MRESETYELSYWLKQDEKGEVPEKTLADLRQKIAELGGQILNEIDPSRRRFAYPIRKEQEGFFGTLKCGLPAEAVEKLHQGFTRETNLLRLMVSKAMPVSAPKPFRRPSLKTKSPEAKKGVSSLQDFDKKLEEILKT